MSVARPASPMMVSSWILKTFWKELLRVRSSFPILRSVAMPTQSFPTMPTMVPPLY